MRATVDIRLQNESAEVTAARRVEPSPGSPLHARDLREAVAIATEAALASAIRIHPPEPAHRPAAWCVVTSPTGPTFVEVPFSPELGEDMTLVGAEIGRAIGEALKASFAVPVDGEEA